MIKYTDLCNGIKNGYAPAESLVQLHDNDKSGLNVDRKPIGFQQSCKRFIAKVDEVLKDIEVQSGKKIEKFTIGNAYTREMKTKVKFLEDDFTTWIKKDIGDHWRNKSKKGYHGLVVLGLLSQNIRDDRNVTVENLTSAINQHFNRLSDYRFECNDTSVGTGSRGKTEYTKFMLYVAVKFETPTQVPGNSTNHQSKEVKPEIVQPHGTLQSHAMEETLTDLYSRLRRAKGYLPANPLVQLHGNEWRNPIKVTGASRDEYKIESV